MFGYVVVNKPELKFKEYDVYHEYYCGLCKTIKKRYGMLPRFTLSNDLTFLAILLGSLYEPQTKIQCKHCAVHPLKKMSYCSNKYLDYCSDMNVYLSYLKCLDDYNDDKNLFKYLFSLILKKKALKIENLYLEKTQYIKSKMSELTLLEKEKCDDIDKVSGVFGDLLGCVCAVEDDFFADSLRRMGFFLGKYIYLCDAYDDLAQDKKSGSYNPLITYENRDDFDAFVKDILVNTMSECCKHFEYLPIVENINLLRNILYAGVWTNIKNVDKLNVNGNLNDVK